MVAKVGFIASSGVRACLLEVSAGKPGNVSPGKGFSDTSYRDFVEGSRALRPVLRVCAGRGFRVGRGLLSVEEVGVGRLVKEAVLAVRRSHRGGNTHLGVVLLLVPLAVAAGWCLGSGSGFSRLRFFLRRVLLGTTVWDSVDLFDAINVARPGGLGRSNLDVRDARSEARLRRLGMSLLGVMEYSSRRDMVASELACGMPVVFGFVVPNLRRNAKKTGDIKKAIAQTYLQTLSKYPDTLIARKVGMKKAKEVSSMARVVLKAGGVYTPNGRSKIREFDSQLRSDGNKLNPGTTADLITAGLFIHLLTAKV